MKPRVRLASTKTRNGLDVFLYAHDDSFGISIDGKELMHSKASASECYLGEIGVSHLINGVKSRILIGGLGLGFTLKSVLSHSSSFVKVDVVEIIPEIIDWNKTFLHGLNGSLLEDPRVNVVNADVSEIIYDTQSNFYDGIILDLDNGPVPMVDENNAKLYKCSGIQKMNRKLRSNGRIAIWSAGPDLDFEDMLKINSINFSKIQAKVYQGAKRARHLIYVIKKY